MYCEGARGRGMVQREFEEYAKKLAGEQAIKDAAEQKAQEERERRFQKKIAIAQVLVPFVTFVLGIVIDHFSDLIEPFWRWVKEFIK